MRLPDTEVLVNAFRPEVECHAEFRAFVEEMVNGEETYAISDLVVNSFLRIVTDQRIYKDPDPIGDALKFAAVVRNQPRAVVVAPGRRHWEIFERLCRETDASGKAVPDAYLAALAIEHGCEFVTCDADFAQFKGLRMRHPLN
ncbi:VapC toxin family PIN domain ribonuclease [Spongiactinospora gelatinilytica]|uniref:Ribonuclease VapC n=1 Tax=Spongiactinospora gelatinilytica TaxID=2666298 RepID=A0A2W2GDZ5_9ACTN|nr:VapC toxin family PIN domain ribonuclease [Spongiactinospora gelatinilytica]